MSEVPLYSLIISVLFITLTCNLPEWCDKIKLSNLPLYSFVARCVDRRCSQMRTRTARESYCRDGPRSIG